VARRPGGLRAGDVSGGLGPELRRQRVAFLTEIRDRYLALYGPGSITEFMWHGLDDLVAGRAVRQHGWEVDVGDRTVPGVDHDKRYELTDNDRVVELMRSPDCEQLDRAPGCRLEHDHWISVVAWAE
jgi:hypothetical protein